MAEMELVEVGPGLHACLQPDTGLGASNSGLITAGGGLVIDTFWDLPRTRALRDHYATVLAEPPKRVVNTHHNGDHCWGNQLFAETGAELIGHRRCAEGMAREPGPDVLRGLCATPDDQLGAMAGFVRALRAFDFTDVVPTPPTTLIDDDTELELDGLAVELIYLGPAHTGGDTIVHVPEHGVVFAGDLVFHRCTPIGWDGTHAAWVAALERIASLDPAVVVPGHGPLADVTGVLALRDYLVYVHDEAVAHREAGRTPLEAAQRIELGPYAGWTEPERIAFNVHRVYREQEGVNWDEPFDLGPVIADMVALRSRSARG